MIRWWYEALRIIEVRGYRASTAPLKLEVQRSSRPYHKDMQWKRCLCHVFAMLRCSKLPAGALRRAPVSLCAASTP